MRAFIGVVAEVSILMICAGSVGAQSIPGIGYRAGAGSGPVVGAAGGGSVVGAEGLERCDAPLGLIAVADPRDEMIRVLWSYRLQSPVQVIRLMVQQSNCFTVVERGVGAEYILRLLPKGTHQYAKFIKPSELARYIRQANLEVIGMKGLTYNPVTQVYRLSDDTDVNYMIAVRKPLE